MSLSMTKAKAMKIDEFYTQFSDIEEELVHYKKFFFKKKVYCCCDNPEFSNFVKFFLTHFYDYGLRKLFVSCSSIHETTAMWVEYSSPESCVRHTFIGNGSITSAECNKIFKETDIVVTNPPFSKAKFLIKYLIHENKSFIIVGNRNIITSDTMFEFFMKKEIRFGFGFKSNTANFIIPEELYGHYSKDVVRKEKNIVRFRNVTWFTNLPIYVPPLKRIYTKKYDPQKYKKYDQFDAINIDKISEIPIDYTGKMGVPITILDKFDYGQFQLLGIDRTIQGNNTKTRFSVNGKRKYVRVIIINKKTNGEKIQTCNK